MRFHGTPPSLGWRRGRAGQNSPAARPLRISLYAGRHRSYARLMRTQFSLWLGMIGVGLLLMVIIGFSGR
jgi:hypothetical protein